MELYKVDDKIDLHKLSLDESYGMQWPEGTSQLVKELTCFRLSRHHKKPLGVKIPTIMESILLECYGVMKMSAYLSDTEKKQSGTTTSLTLSQRYAEARAYALRVQLQQVRPLQLRYTSLYRSTLVPTRQCV